MCTMFYSKAAVGKEEASQKPSNQTLLHDFRRKPHDRHESSVPYISIKCELSR